MEDAVDLDLLFGDKEAWVTELREIRHEVAVGAKAYVGAIRRLQTLEAALGISGEISGPRSEEIREATALMASQSRDVQGEDLTGIREEDMEVGMGASTQNRWESLIVHIPGKSGGLAAGALARQDVPVPVPEAGQGEIIPVQETGESPTPSSHQGREGEQQRAALRILVGDSIARDSPIARGQDTLSLARGGNSFGRQDFEEVKASVGPSTTAIYIWLGGNDCYPGGSQGGLPAAAGELVRRCADLAPVVVITPTPRIRFDEGRPWEATPAFRAEVALAAFADGQRVRVVRPGRCLTTHLSGRRFVRNRALWARDGIHLSSSGHAKVWSFIASRT